MAIQDTDTILVNRGGTNYRTDTSNIMAIQDTDLLLVNRGGTNYKVTGNEVKQYVSGGPARDWKPSATGLPADTGFSQLSYNDGRFLGIIGSTTYYSDDDGLTWNLGRNCPGGAMTRAAGSGFLIASFGTSGAGASYPVYGSDDGVNNWEIVTNITFGNSSAGISPARASYLRITPFGAPGVSFSTYWNNLSGFGVSNFHIIDASLTLRGGGNLTTDTTGSSGVIMFNPLAGVSNTEGYLYAGPASRPNGADPQSSVWGMSPTGVVTLASAGGSNGATAVEANGNIVSVLNSSAYTLNTKVYIVPDPYTTAGITTASPGVGTNSLRCGQWDPGKNVLVMAGTGGSITNSYDGGFTWRPSDLQYETPGVAEQTFTVCAASPTCFILSSPQIVLRASI